MGDLAGSDMLWTDKTDSFVVMTVTNRIESRADLDVSMEFQPTQYNVRNLFGFATFNLRFRGVELVADLLKERLVRGQHAASL